MLIAPLNAVAAEVLQVRSSSLLQIGDRNRSYSVKLACVDVESSKEDAAINLLKNIFRKRKRVNIRPQSSNDGILLARVIPIESDSDLAQILSEKGLSTSTC